MLLCFKTEASFLLNFIHLTAILLRLMLGVALLYIGCAFTKGTPNIDRNRMAVRWMKMG